MSPSLVNRTAFLTLVLGLGVLGGIEYHRDQSHGTGQMEPETSLKTHMSIASRDESSPDSKLATDSAGTVRPRSDAKGAAHFRRWTEIRTKTMPSSQEIGVYDAALADPEVHEHVVSLLNDQSVRAWHAEQEHSRLAAVDFIVAGLRSQSEPARELSESSLLKVMSADLGAYNHEENHQLRSRIGDRIELVDAFLALHKDRYIDLVTAAGDIRTLNAMAWLITSRAKRSTL